MIKDSFEFTGKNGTCRIEAEYEGTVENRINDLDGMQFKGKLEARDKGNLVAYANGKKFDSCPGYNTYGWQLADYKVNGETVKKIRGLKVAIADPKVAEEYAEWIEKILEDGKTKERKAFEAEKESEQLAQKKEQARQLIEKAEKQDKIPTYKELKQIQRQWRDTYNEGGEGYVPEMITLEEYERAQEILKK